MVEPASIAGRALEALARSGVVTGDQVEVARQTALDDGEAGRAVLERQLVTPAQLGSVLETELGFPRVDLESYAPDDDALTIMPADLAREYRVLPLFEIEGTLTVAIGDPGDVFVLDSIGQRIGYSMDAVLADESAVRAAVLQHFGSAAVIEPAFAADVMPSAIDDVDVSVADLFALSDAADMPVVTEAPQVFDLSDEVTSVPDMVAPPAPVATAAPVAPVATVDSAASSNDQIDLDVLAVADERKVALLVTEVLEAAVERGATRVHLLPYKTDFFLVFRIQGRLEKVASAPISMQQPLIDGFKSFAKLSGVAANRPALGRMNVEIGGRQVLLTVSVVPTVAGQRLVLTIAPVKPSPQALIELGMPEAESRALHALVERGRGLVLVAAPITGGRSTTYYSLLNHAAQAGRTVYSVERSVDFEIPAVAQVMVNPGESVGAAAYFAAGIRQDTDVMAIDSLESAEDVHLAIKATGMGKLVIATCAASDVVSAVRRLLDMGTEPTSLANAIVLGVGQRVIRTNCPACSTETRSAVADKIPGAEPGLVTRRGAGCPECQGTGFAGAVGLFEVLPFTEPVRTVISHGGSAAAIEAAARAAGMRPMITSGLAKVREGVVSAEELERVLRFS